MKNNFILTAFAVAILLCTSSLSAQTKKKSGKTPFYKTIPSSSFFTINAEYLGGYRPDQFFSAQVPAFGFKAGTMRNFGWFLSGMTNFNFKGAFVTCEPSEINTEVTSSTYFDVFGGITLRYWKPLSFHLGLGYAYRSFNNETIYGQWAHIPSHTAQGPATTAGFMLHLGVFVVSAEMLLSYNLQGINHIDYHVDKTRLSFGAKAGLGLCVPYRDRDLPTERQTTSLSRSKGPVYYSQPTETVTVAETTTTTGSETQPAPEPKVKSESPVVMTLPVSQINPGWITVSGQITEEGNEAVTERGICWSTTPYPSVTGQHTSDGAGAGYFTTVINDLEPGTVYYLRAYAGTRSGIRYGNTVSVTLPDVPKEKKGPKQPVAPTFPPAAPAMAPVQPATVPVQPVMPPAPPAMVPVQPAMPPAPPAVSPAQTEATPAQTEATPAQTEAPQTETVPSESASDAPQQTDDTEETPIPAND